MTRRTVELHYADEPPRIVFEYEGHVVAEHEMPSYEDGDSKSRLIDPDKRYLVECSINNLMIGLVPNTLREM